MREIFDALNFFALLFFCFFFFLVSNGLDKKSICVGIAIEFRVQMTGVMRSLPSRGLTCLLGTHE